MNKLKVWISNKNPRAFEIGMLKLGYTYQYNGIISYFSQRKGRLL